MDTRLILSNLKADRHELIHGAAPAHMKADRAARLARVNDAIDTLEARKRFAPGCCTKTVGFWDQDCLEWRTIPASADDAFYPFGGKV